MNNITSAFAALVKDLIKDMPPSTYEVHTYYAVNALVWYHLVKELGAIILTLLPSRRPIVLPRADSGPTYESDLSEAEKEA